MEAEFAPNISHETFKDDPFNSRITNTVIGATGRVANFTGPIVDRSAPRQDLWSDYSTYCSYGLPEEFVRDIFDCWGRLKPQYRTHPVAKGIGVWGNELNAGNIFILDGMYVDEGFQRQGIGSRAFQQLWACATADYKCEYCFARAHRYCGSDGPGSSAEGMTTEEYADDQRQKAIGITYFLRSLGFRRVGNSAWFCLAKDPNHPSWYLPSRDDYDTYDTEISSSRVAIELHNHMSSLDDGACVTHLTTTSRAHPSSDPFWLAVGHNNNTILHVAFWPVACGHSEYTTKTRTIEWLLDQPFAATLLSAKNMDGFTPAESFTLYLTQQRAFQLTERVFYPICESFRQHTTAEITCLFRLQGRAVGSISPDERLRASYGCTCGTCLGGFLSPRMLLSLYVHAYEASN